MTVAVKREAIREAQRLIRTALELVSDEKRWTKGAYARDRLGHSVVPGSRKPKPAAWCLIGAVWEVEHRTVTAEGGRPTGSGTLFDSPTHRLALALIATWLGCEHALRSAGRGRAEFDVTLEFGEEYTGFLPEQIAWLNDLPRTRHADILQVLAIADQLLVETEK